jgi:hypothetical protein
MHMHSEPKRINVHPDSELARLLDEAAAAPVLLEKDGVVYRLTTDESADLWADYDPTKVEETLNAVAGSWSDVDADALIATLYRAREEGSRPADRPL